VALRNVLVAEAELQGVLAALAAGRRVTLAKWPDDARLVGMYVEQKRRCLVLQAESRQWPDGYGDMGGWETPPYVTLKFEVYLDEGRAEGVP
jgi:hypothetical protein